MRFLTTNHLIAAMVQHLYDAENQLIIALPRVIVRGSTSAIRDALDDHLEETKLHAARLEDVADELKVSPCGCRCIAMQGLIKHTDEVAGYGGDPQLVDAAVMHMCHSVEYFEISQYSSLIDLCQCAANHNASQVLQQTLSEEKKAAETLHSLTVQSLLSPR
jgi:ferritin-like metal-binding protein YciE